MTAATKAPVAYWREAIRDSRTLSGPAKGVAHALASRMKTGSLQCWPSTATLAADAGFCRRTVDRALAELRAAGFLRWTTNADRSANIYAGLFPQPAAEHPAEVAQEMRNPSQEVAQEMRNGCAGDAHKLETELERIPPLPLPKEGKRGGAAQWGNRRNRIPRGPQPDRLAAKTQDPHQSTRHRSLAEDLNDTSWAG